jgi:hypothetical protein
VCISYFFLHISRCLHAGIDTGDVVYMLSIYAVYDFMALGVGIRPMQIGVSQTPLPNDSG